MNALLVTLLMALEKGIHALYSPLRRREIDKRMNHKLRLAEKLRRNWWKLTTEQRLLVIHAYYEDDEPDMEKARSRQVWTNIDRETAINMIMDYHRDMKCTPRRWPDLGKEFRPR